MKNFFKINFSLIFLLIALFAVFITNFSPSTFLIGWDNRLQELSPILNLKRYIFSVWQEYQGLGLLAGHAHASEIPHALFIAFLSLVLPINTIRQVFVFLMLLIGPVGVYFLVKNLVSYKNNFLNKTIPLIGALFYLFNLSTIQTFYTPLEPFIIHYAFLPWLFLSALYFVANKTRKALVFFVVVNILVIPQAQIPTVFFVYLFALFFFLTVLILETRNKELIKRLLKILFITLVINSFWLLPFIYFYLTNGNVAFEAKINQMSTETIFQQNKEFGDIWNVMLLKGFWFNNVDPNLKGNFTYMLSGWREHLNILISSLGYLFFAVILTGFIYVKRKAPFVIPFSALFILAFTMLATNTPPFSWIDYLLRQIPVFNEIFRFPFTKFSILASLTYSFFFAIGIGKLFLLAEKFFKPKALILYSIIPIFIVLMLLFIFPIFQGNLFYQKEKIKIPEEYAQLFNFLKTQNPNTRIANFPQHTFWGWNFYNWGYGGSGFLWYGVKQPILDRAFDVWSKYDENYYWEVSYALYSKNASLFENVLNKYQINYLLVDKNVINPSSPKALFTPETEKLISELPSIQKKVSFGNIDVYQVNLRENINNFVFLTHKNLSVNKYNWNNFDSVYPQSSNYVSTNAKPNIFYPFQTLFSGKNEENKEFALNEKQDSVVFSQKIPSFKEGKLNIPSAFAKNDLIAVLFNTEKNPDGSFLIKADLKTPQIYLGKQKVWGQSISRPLFLIPANGPKQFSLYFGNLNFNINLTNGKKDLGSTYASVNGNNIVYLTSPSFFHIDLSSEIYSIINQPNSLDLKTNGDNEFRVEIPKVTDKYLTFTKPPYDGIKSKVKNCENFRKGKISSFVQNNDLYLDSKNSTACISFFIPSVSHNQGYAIFVENQNLEGRPLHFWVLNEDQKLNVLDTYLPKNKEKSTTSFVIPSYEEFGEGYSLNFEDISISDETKNKLGKISLYPIPYQFLTAINIELGQEGAKNVGSIGNLDVKHPNESIYVVNAQNMNSGSMIVLSQAYDLGWRAYEVKNNGLLTSIFPFIFSNELKDHVLVNNWENGFVLNNKTMEQSNNTIIIVYLPQYLEYLGFLILLFVPIYLLKLKK